jgi:hypothetical protein
MGQRVPLRSGYVFRYDSITKYAHMVTLETVPLLGGAGGGSEGGSGGGGDGSGSGAGGGGRGGGDDDNGYLMFAAWQAAPLADLEGGEIKMAVEVGGAVQYSCLHSVETHSA